ncbi:hypothetical protein ACJ73_00221 [Blastomyces percursus]|uniref:HORMA domain-containing protein n=1 Tax=Blastomyces percursus TaxID=1658174 RepID=A0A1J9RK81_9EURO|nr:hypothetical protein ACJ73_00221 [Blastomyces percursus]
MAQSNNGVASDCNLRSPGPSGFPFNAQPAAAAVPAPSPNNNNDAGSTTTSTNSNNSNINNHTHSHRTSPLPDTYAALASSVASFLAVSIHQILYLRAIYPQPTFLPVRHFNHPVRQSRHPKVCTWVTDACAAVEGQLLKCSVAAVSVVILSARTNRPLERYTFDMTQIPEVPASDVHTPFENSSSADQQEQQLPSATKPQTHPRPAPIDLEAQFRAVLARLASACARLTPLPRDEEYTPTLHIVLRNNADSPAGVTKEEQLWIAAEPGRKVDMNNTKHSNNSNTTRYLNPTGTSNGSDNDDSFGNNSTMARNGGGGTDGSSRHGSRGRAKTVPVRTVDAGEMKLEVWIEEAKGKFEELDRIRAEHPP